jgi:hypothetical protein
MSEDKVVLRTPVWLAVLRVLPVEMLVAATGVFDLRTGDRFGAVPLGGALLALLLTIALAVRFRVELRPDELRVVGWSRRVIPWSRVQSVQPATGSWFTLKPTTVYDGHIPVPLRPLTPTWPWASKRPDPRYHQIGEYWLAHRGAAWLPLPLPAVPPSLDARADPYAPPHA